MDPDSFFRLLLVAVFVILKAVRAYYQRRAGGIGALRKDAAGARDLVLLALFALPMTIAVLAYLIRPACIAWASFGAPAWLRWTGAGLCVLQVPFLFWIHRALDRNFSPLVTIREKHTLVTHGPYARIRHPMYTAWIMLGAGVSLMSASWLITATWPGLLSIYLVVRVRTEEAVLLERFGREYRDYQARSGRLTPWL